MPSKPTRPGKPISEREHQVLDLIAQGKTNDEISTALDISFHTAHFYVARAIIKLGATNRTHAASLWTERKLRVEFSRERMESGCFATNVF